MKDTNEPIEPAIAVCRAIQGLSGIDVVYADKGGNSVYESFSIPRPALLASFLQEDLAHTALQAGKLAKNESFLYTNKYRLSYIAVPFHAQTTDQGVIITGPFLQEAPDDVFIRSVMEACGAGRSEYRQFAFAYQNLPVLDESKIRELGNALNHMGRIPMNPAELVRGGAANNNHPLTAKLHQGYTSVQHDLIERRYEWERQMLHAVQQGDMEQVNTILELTEGQFDFTYRLPQDPLRAIKNGSVTLNTLLRKAAENGGVHPVDVHMISESYAIRLEKARTFSDVKQLVTLMTGEYCTAVRKLSITGFTPLIRQALRWLQLHYNGPFSLSALAKDLHSDPAHLSRQFKKETGQTLTAYITHKRIEEAKYLLRSGKRTVSETAGMAGFSDLNHFGKVFKKTVGCTPSEYIRGGEAVKEKAPTAGG